MDIYLKQFYRVNFVNVAMIVLLSLWSFIATHFDKHTITFSAPFIIVLLLLGLIGWTGKRWPAFLILIVTIAYLFLMTVPLRMTMRTENLEGMFRVFLVCLSCIGAVTCYLGFIIRKRSVR